MEMKTTVARLLAAAAFTASLTAASAHAQSQPAQNQPPMNNGEARPHREPPPQAYDDCKGKKEGDTVQITTPEGAMAATCAPSPKGLFARPEHPPREDGSKGSQGALRHEPPQLAFDACKGKNEGDTVQITTPRGALDATCAPSPKGLFARPAHPPRDEGNAPAAKGPAQQGTPKP